MPAEPSRSNLIPRTFVFPLQGHYFLCQGSFLIIRSFIAEVQFIRSWLTEDIVAQNASLPSPLPGDLPASCVCFFFHVLDLEGGQGVVVSRNFTFFLPLPPFLLLFNPSNGEGKRSSCFLLMEVATAEMTPVVSPMHGPVLVILQWQLCILTEGLTILTQGQQT